MEQARRTARLPILNGHIALMPDAHLGIGATIGSVIPTRGAIIPSAVGVDIGCGMVAVETVVNAAQLPDNLTPLLHAIRRAVPAGVGKGHTRHTPAWDRWITSPREAPGTDLTDKQLQTAALQFGTLGSGNHFFEICLDERDVVWVIMHSGSRGIGNQLAQAHIKVAATLNQQPLEDRNLAWLTDGTPAFERYIRDLVWSQDYALGNRNAMMDAALRDIAYALGANFAESSIQRQRINCHHNYAAKEEHGGSQVWVTRKGAILAERGTLGLIPGSMGARSYVVHGLGNPESYNSAPHGAGRTMSRTQARKRYTGADLTAAMGDRAWLANMADALVDEIPAAYKDIDVVMADAADLVEIVHTLHQVVNYKGL